MTPTVYVHDDRRTPTGEWVLEHPCCQDYQRGDLVTLIVVGRADPIDAHIVGRWHGMPTATPTGNDQ